MPCRMKVLRPPIQTIYGSKHPKEPSSILIVRILSLSCSLGAHMYSSPSDGFMYQQLEKIDLAGRIVNRLLPSAGLTSPLSCVVVVSCQPATKRQTLHPKSMLHTWLMSTIVGGKYMTAWPSARTISWQSTLSAPTTRLVPNNH